MSADLHAESLTPSSRQNQQALALTTFRKILFLLTPSERRETFVLLGLMLIGMVMETLGIGLIIPVIALLMQSDLGASYPKLQPMLATLGNPSQTQLIAWSMLVLVALYLVKALFLAFLTWRQNKFAFGVQSQLSQRLFTIYLRQPYTFHLQRNSAQLMRNATGEVAMFAGLLGNVTGLVTEGLVLLGIAILLLAFEPLGAVIVGLVLGVAAWAFQQSTKDRVRRWGVARQHHEGQRIQHLLQGLGGAKDVKLLGRESDFLGQYRTHNEKSARVGQLEATLQQLPRLWLELLAAAGLATLVLTMLAQGRSMTSIVPILSLFAAAAFRLMPSVNRILGSIQSVRYSMPAINTLHEEFSLAAPEPAAIVKVGPTFHSDITLSDVSYTYPAAASLALKGLSISIKKGASAGFIGASGSGKSTLVDVILGLLSPTAGAVRVDGQDIQYNLRAWQNQIGYVPQSIYLTDDTLKRNVAFGLSAEKIDDAAVRRAVEAAQLDTFVASLPEGLQTVVGERGIRLSGGQRQRIGIARALYHDPAVLVLDEATSALDIATEQGVMQAVTALQGSKTVLIVAHRFSTVEHCDTLYRIEGGRVVAEGTPSEMLKLRQAHAITKTA